MAHRILLVEDSLTQALRIQLELTSYGLQTEVARTGTDGLQAAREHMPDVIILDIDLPGMDGFSVCRAIKSDPITAHIPVVMLTHHDQAMDALKGSSAGANGYVAKDLFAENNLVSSLEQLGVI